MLLEAGCKRKEWTRTSEYQYEFQWIASGSLIAKGVCLEPNYRSYFVPEAGNTLVYSTIEEQAVRNVDAKEETVSIDFTLVMRWLDPNINTHFTDDDIAQGGITLDENKASRIWTPDLYIFNVTSFKDKREEERIKSLRILSREDFSQLQYASRPRRRGEKTAVELRIEVKKIIYCRFYHRLYPIDSQKCRITLGSRSLGAIFHLYDPDKNFHHLHRYEAVSFDMTIEFFDQGYSDGNNTIGFDITMDRIYEPFIWKYYVPCIAIVSVSGLSFIIPISAIPGRVALLVTQFLSLINLFIFQMVSYNAFFNFAM